MTEKNSPESADLMNFVDLSNMDSMDALLGTETKSNFAEGSIIEGSIVEK